MNRKGIFQEETVDPSHAEEKEGTYKGVRQVLYLWRKLEGLGSSTVSELCRREKKKSLGTDQLRGRIGRDDRKERMRKPPTFGSPRHCMALNKELSRN